MSWRLTGDALVRVLVDGQTRSVTTRAARSGGLVVRGLTAGPHLLVVQIVDAAGTPGASSAPVAVTIDAAPPSTPPGLAIGPARSTGRLLSWQASSDSGSGVAGYLVALDGGAPVRVGDVASALVRAPAGRHTWAVIAVDRAGNASAPATLVTVIGASTGARAVRAD